MLQPTSQINAVFTTQIAVENTAVRKTCDQMYGINCTDVFESVIKSDVLNLSGDLFTAQPISKNMLTSRCGKFRTK